MSLDGKYFKYHRVGYSTVNGVVYGMPELSLSWCGCVMELEMHFRGPNCAVLRPVLGKLQDLALLQPTGVTNDRI